MIKNVLKFTLIFLIFISVLAVPVLGVRNIDVFGKDSGFNTPSIFDENVLFTDRQLGGGTSVFLAFTDKDNGNITAEDYQIAANTLKERFVAMGYTDAETEVVEDMIRVDIAQKTYIDTVVSEIASVGDWSFVGSSMTESLCDASMVESAEIATTVNGTYGVTITFNEEGAKKFNENTASSSSTSSSFYLMIDGQLMAIASVPAGGVDKTFSFGNFQDSQSAAMIASYINNGALPSAVEIAKTEELAPSLNGVVITILTVAIAAIILLLAAIALIKGKMNGLFVVFAIISNICVLATSVANHSFMLNLATLIAMTLFTVLASIFYLMALKSVKENGLKGLNKISIKSAWIHAAAFLAALIFYMFSRGSLLYIAKALINFSVSDFVFYFVYFYFGVYTVFKKER